MKQLSIKVKNIFLFFHRRKIESFILTLLFLWFTFSVKPFPFIQISDGYFLWTPRLSHAVREIVNFQIPFWNAYQFCGTALLADGNTNVLNPMTIFYFLMNPYWAYTLAVMILFLFLITGTWAYFRERGFSKTASIIGTIGYVYGGQTIIWSIYHGMNLCMAIFPWMLFAFRRFEKTNEIKWKIFAFILMFLSATGGFIQFALIGAFSVFIEGIDKFSFDSIKKNFKNRFLTIFLAVSSASFIIMPTIEAAIFSHRKLVPYFSNYLPSKFHLALLTFWGISFGEYIHPNHFYYIGIVLIALSIFAIRKYFKNIFMQPYFAYSLIFPAIIILIYSGILPDDFQFGVNSEPWRGMFVFILSLSIIAAIGTERYVKQLKGKAELVFPPFELLIAGFVSLYIGFSRFIVHKHNTIVDAIVVTALGLLILSGFILATVFKKQKPPFRATIFSGWLIVLIIANGFYSSNIYLKTNVAYAAGLIDPCRRTGLPVDVLSDEGRVVNIALHRGYYFEHWAIYNKIRALGGYGSFFPKSIFLRMKKDKILPAEFHAATHFQNNSVLDPDILAKYGVLYLVANKRVGIYLGIEGWQFFQGAGNNAIYRNPKYVGRAYTVDKKGNIIKGADIVKDANSYIKISVDVDGGNVLILADSWFPGWVCYDNGRKAQSFDADGFRGYYIEEGGHHDIEWIYKPLSFLIAFIVSVVSFIAFLVLIFKK